MFRERRLNRCFLPAYICIVEEQKGPVLSVLDEFCMVEPGPSSSHTIGLMRITYDFCQRCMKLPAREKDLALRSTSTQL
jgi:hypothetical protein